MTTFSTTRYFAASPATLFEAIRNPERLVRWWGPLGFTNRFHAFDFQPGGEWRFDMIGPDGTVHPNESRFEHIEPERRVVIQHTCAPFFRLAITSNPPATAPRSIGIRPSPTPASPKPSPTS